MPYILVTGLVASANAGSFNNIVLVDSKGNAIPGQSLIGSNSGYTQGTTFQVLLPVPAGGGISQTIKVQTQQVSNGQTTVVSTSTSSSTLTTTEAGVTVGIVDMLPDAVYLTQDNPEQMITFSNSGDAEALLQSLVASNPNIEVIFSPGPLNGAVRTTTAVLKLKDPTVPATSGDITVTYNNGQQEVSDSAVVEENVIPAPTPDPSPTPTPSAPVAGLTAILSPDNNFFTGTAVGTVARELTLTNTGNTDENAIALTLPSNFTISGGSSNSCTVTQSSSPAAISDTLAAGGSCKVTVTYANNTVTAAGSGTISIAYNYNSGTAATPTPAGVNYRVNQSTANLTLSPTSQNYGSISSDNTTLSPVQTFTLTNSGEVAATNLVFSFAGTDASLFTRTGGGTCTPNGSLSNSNTCTIATQFGPAPNGSAGAKGATFNVSYTPYTGGATVTTADVNLSGTVTAAPSANYTVSYTNTGSPFTSGAGTSGSSYQGYTGSSYTIQAIYTNTSAVVAATGFTTSYTPPTGWSRTTHGCNNVSMVANTGTCTDVYTLNSEATGTHNLLLQNVTASWTDGSGTYSSRPTAGSEVYVNLTTPPAITIAPAPVANWQTMMGSAYVAFTATITGGSSTVTPTVSGLTGNTVSPASCALNSSASATSSCTFIVTPYTGTGNYSFWDPANIANSTDVNTPSNAYTPVTNISLQVTADNSATINGSASPQTFSSITGTVIAPYVYLAAAVPGDTATAGTGITWGSGGTVSNRFIAGSNQSGGDCTDSLKDNLTGLEWAKNGIIGFEDTNGGVPIAQPNYANTTANLNDLGWSNAAIAINNMNTATTKLCGYSDWRLPNINELRSLVNYAATQTSSTPAAWLETQGFTNVQVDYNYWSSTAYASTPDNAWNVNMNGGYVGLGDKTASILYVWPVRGGQ